MIADDQHFSMRLAASTADVAAAQRLRYVVFIEELGGNGPLVDHVGRRELDDFDQICEHLLLIDDRVDARSGDHVIGAYRLLPGSRIGNGPGQTRRFYSEGEYDLAPLRASGRRLLELGRSCVHPDHRGGTVMHRLWTGLAEYVTLNRIEILFGVASFHGTDLDELAQPLSFLHHSHLAPPDLRPRAVVQPGGGFVPLSPGQVDRRRAVQALPALIKAYLRLGGFVGDGVFLDHAFNTTDVCLVMDTTLLSARHRAFYTRQAEQTA